MNKKFKEKLLQFVEAEQKTGIDQALLDRLHEYLLMDTMYFDLPAERRNTLNKFFSELHDLLLAGLLEDKYGTGMLIESIIVTAFETGYRLGRAEKEEGRS